MGYFQFPFSYFASMFLSDFLFLSSHLSEQNLVFHVYSLMLLWLFLAELEEKKKKTTTKPHH